MNTYQNFLCVFSLLLLQVSCYTPPNYIKRSTSGDIFDAPCNTCHLYDSQCAYEGYSCCTKCQCDSKETYYKGLCRHNIHSDIADCAYFLEDDDHFFFSHDEIITVALRHSGVSTLGKIVYGGEWWPDEYQTCYEDINEASYWNTDSWIDFQHEDVRSLNDFQTQRHDSHVKLLYVGGTNRISLYEGLLIRLVVTCHNYQHGRIKSCLLFKVGGERRYESLIATTSTTTTTTTQTTTLATTPIAKTTLVTTVETTPSASTTTNIVSTESETTLADTTINILKTTKITTNRINQTIDITTPLKITTTHKQTKINKEKDTTVSICGTSKDVDVKNQIWFEKHKTDDNRKDAEYTVGALAGVGGFLMGFCCLYMIFGKHRRRRKERLLMNTIPLQSYYSQAQSPLPPDYETVHEPSYLDFNELKLLEDDFDSSLATTASEPQLSIPPNINQQNVNGVYYMNVTDTVPHKTDSIRRPPSESQDTFDYTPLNKGALV